ncbi:MAG: glutamate racemase, partial [Pseudomonadales bacterium]|nr:glutamate racemase [Pseudomonadales bacterium]
MNAPALRVGVFDSGVGGLTVLRALRAALPDADFLYLGDTARLPYGTKSSGTVERYALRAAASLVDRRIDALVVACNTASAVALGALTARWPTLPVLGVIEPGAAAAVAGSVRGDIAVIATESTVRGGAYQAALQRLAPACRVRARACSVFVALAEEGWFQGPVTRATVEAYLGDWFGPSRSVPDGDAPRPDTLVLGCTHFPMLAGEIRRYVGDAVLLVDSATTTATALCRQLGRAPAPSDAPRRGCTTLFATDGRERFAAIGGQFL